MVVGRIWDKARHSVPAVIPFVIVAGAFTASGLLEDVVWKFLGPDDGRSRQISQDKWDTRLRIRDKRFGYVGELLLLL